MPLFYFYCKDCDLEERALLSVKRSAMVKLCKACEHPMLRNPKPATSRITESLDNGLMSRKIERPADSERLYKERAQADQERLKQPV